MASIFRGIRPAVVALIAVPTFNLAKSAQLTWTTAWIPVVGALAIWALGVSPIIIILFKENKKNSTELSFLFEFQ